jgi:retron-type reverse transcriptase
VEIIVMDYLSHLWKIFLEEIFLACSHGFRKARRAITFFLKINSWGPVFIIIKSDIVESFDNIDHGLLISVLPLGKENPLFRDLILSFLQRPILDIDKKGTNSSNHTKGIPQA